MNHKNRKWIVGIMIILISVFVMGCSNNKSSNNKEDKLVVAVSIVPEKTFVEAVCGDLVDVTVMIPPGNSPANYEPTPQEIEQFSKSKLYFAIGVPTELANIIPKTTELESMKVIKLHEEVANVYPELEIAAGERDQHIWLSPKRTIVMVESILREMSALDPDHKEIYEENAQSYIKALEALDLQLKTELENISNRKFIVFHPAFQYLADDYNLEMVALEEDGKEATAQRLQEMIDLAKSQNIKLIFYQAEISSKQAEAFAEEIGGQTIQLAPLAPNYIENLEQMIELMVEVMQ